MAIFEGREKREERYKGNFLHALEGLTDRGKEGIAERALEHTARYDFSGDGRAYLHYRLTQQKPVESLNPDSM